MTKSSDSTPDNPYFMDLKEAEKIIAPLLADTPRKRQGKRTCIFNMKKVYEALYDCKVNKDAPDFVSLALAVYMTTLYIDSPYVDKIRQALVIFFPEFRSDFNEIFVKWEKEGKPKFKKSDFM